MSSPRFTATPSGFPTPKPATFIAANSTVAKVLLEPFIRSPAVAATPTPDFYGGGTILDITAASTDSVAKDVILYAGKVLSTQGSATGSITLTAQNNLARATVSPYTWITEGWLIGDLAMIFAAPGTAQVASGIDGISGTVTAVTAADLTVNGTPWTSGTNVLTAGSRIVNISQLYRASVAAGAGNSSGTPNVLLLPGNSNDSALVNTEQKVGDDAMLIAAMASAVSALPAFVSITPRNVARY